MMHSFFAKIFFHAARLYFTIFPIDRGKWRLWLKFRLHLKSDCFQPGVYRMKEKIRMGLTPEEYNDKFMYFWGCWEPNETWAIKKLLRPGDIFIDVGANIGYYSILASRIVGDRGKVIAFEPVPIPAKRFRENVTLNKSENIVFHESAVMDCAGTIKIGKMMEGGFEASSIRSNQGFRESWTVPFGI